MENETADSASASDPKKLTSRGKGHKAKQAAKPAEPLERTPEDPPASDAGSYRSAEEVEADKDAEEEPPVDE
eukprot:3009699-Amphidinium_carterae.1